MMHRPRNPLFGARFNQSINHAAGDAPYFSLKKRIAGYIFCVCRVNASL